MSISVTQSPVQITVVSETSATISVTGMAGKGVPSGGTTGQILAKKSNDDYDLEWVTP